jgi:hypothetical protein
MTNELFLQGFKDAVGGIKQEDICNFDLNYLAGHTRGEISHDCREFRESCTKEEIVQEIQGVKTKFVDENCLMRQGMLDALEDLLLYLELTKGDR